ncbi:hypothetical protein [Xenorhabdus sp. Sc-CR9]|uniref:hypothetical protein n=1 Tax=Xenorhabdus sp. Sc-CR9 TaxID=2584468 RepID=UPI001F2F1468|nr:hypothetical protein [Xenorhabdus sp. Sc-CR9]
MKLKLIKRYYSAEFKLEAVPPSAADCRVTRSLGVNTGTLEQIDSPIPGRNARARAYFLTPIE